MSERFPLTTDDDLRAVPWTATRPVHRARRLTGPACATGAYRDHMAEQQFRTEASYTLGNYVEIFFRTPHFVKNTLLYCLMVLDRVRL